MTHDRQEHEFAHETETVLDAIDAIHRIQNPASISALVYVTSVMDLELRDQHLTEDESQKEAEISQTVNVERDLEAQTYLPILESVGLGLTHKVPFYEKYDLDEDEGTKPGSGLHAEPHPDYVISPDLFFELEDGSRFADFLKKLSSDETEACGRGIGLVQKSLMHQIIIEYGANPSEFDADKFKPGVELLGKLGVNYDNSLEGLLKVYGAAKGRFLGYTQVAEDFGFDYLSTIRTKSLSRWLLHDGNLELMQDAVNLATEVSRNQAAASFTGDFIDHLRTLLQSRNRYLDQFHISEETEPPKAEQLAEIQRLLIELDFISQQGQKSELK